MKTVNRMNCTPELVSVLLCDGTVYHGTMFKKRGYSIALKNATIYFTDNTVAYVPLAIPTLAAISVLNPTFLANSTHLFITHSQW